MTQGDNLSLRFIANAVDDLLVLTFSHGDLERFKICLTTATISLESFKKNPTFKSERCGINNYYMINYLQNT